MKKRKKTPLNTTYDFFYLLSINRLFKKDLHAFRLKYNIKKNGYSFEKDSNSIHAKQLDLFIKYPELMVSYGADIKALAYKYKVPANLFFRFELFLVFDHDGKRFLEDISRSANDKYALDFSNNNKHPIEVDWEKTGRPYVKLLISENWSANGIDSFLKRHKKIIDSFFDKNGQLEIKRGRKLKNWKRNEIIWKLWKLPLKKLLLICNGEIFEYKASAIAYILNKNYGYKLMTSSAIKKVAEQMS